MSNFTAYAIISKFRLKVTSLLREKVSYTQSKTIFWQRYDSFLSYLEWENKKEFLFLDLLAYTRITN